MARVKRPMISISAAAVVLAGILVATCKFSVAETSPKRPARGSVVFGAERPAQPAKTVNVDGIRTLFADVAERVIPTVVQVVPTKVDTVVFYNNPFYHFFGEDFFGGNDPFGMFFGQPNPRQNPRRQQPPVQRQERRQQGLGSGVIVSKDGYILTNFHVVAGATQIEVKTQDGGNYEATIVGSDSLTDVAVLKIKDKVDNLPVAVLGDSEKLRPGDWVLAVGNPFSLSSTVTSGIVSALGRSSPEVGNREMFQSFIQTDAAINPGNSGGALVNIDGELIGINTMIYTRSGGFMGIGFAIPVNMARRVMEDLIYEGKVNRGWLGVNIQPLTADARDAMNLPQNTQGVLIGSVMPGQPAERAGIRQGDLVISIGGKKTTTPEELRTTVANINPGKEVPVVVLRNGKEVTLKVKLSDRDEGLASAKGGAAKTEESREEPAAESDAFENFGVTVADLTPEIRRTHNLGQNARGVVVTQVNPNTQAASEGFRPGDVIRAIRLRGRDEQQVPNVKEFRRLVRQIKPGDPVMLLVEREGTTFFSAFRLRK